MRNHLKEPIQVAAMDYRITAQSEHGVTMHFIIAADNEQQAMEIATEELHHCKLHQWAVIKADEVVE